MIKPSRTWPCFARKESRRSRTMSFTLLSDSLITRLMKEEAAAMRTVKNEEKILQEHPHVPFTAAEFWVKVVRVVAASYFTACEEALRSSKMQRIYLD